MQTLSVYRCLSSCVLVTTILIGCGSSGGDSDPLLADDEPTVLFDGRVDITYPDNFNETIGQRLFNPAVRNAQFLSIATNEANGLDIVACTVVAVSTGDSLEETLAEGPGAVALANLITQSDEIVNGRMAREYLYIDPPVASDPSDNIELTVISRLYYFSDSETSFSETLEISAVCFAPTVSYSVAESQMRSVLDSVVID